MSARLRRSSTLIGAAMISFALARDAAAADKVARLIPPKLRPSTVGDMYPEPRDREALVYLRFTVTSRGEVLDPKVDDGGFHDERFAAAAMRVLRRLRFSPATLEGTPVDYPGARIPIRFGLPNVGGGPIRAITPEFRAEAKKVQTLIESKDLSGAHFHAQWMLSERVKLAFEYAVLQSTLAYTHARAGNVHRALVASRQVTAHTGMSLEKYRPGDPIPNVRSGDFLLTKEILDQMLNLRFVLAASQGFYLDALRAQADRQGLGFVSPEDPSIEESKKMLAMLENALTLRAHVRIGEDKTWSHDLWFHNFAIRALSHGAIDGIHLACDGYNRSLSYMSDVEWTVPERWDDCTIHITGSPDAEFDILEYRNSPNADSTSATN
ncbi:MAG: energy transducer TonB [Gammaproteobacteria bacterium]|nr:energy transducer TonB [Gammaproteobacteria bacterium]